MDLQNEKISYIRDMKEEKDVTTVRLSEIAQKIKDDLTPVYGLKNILSAGLYLFDKLEAQRQKDTINIVLGKIEDPSEVVKKITAQAEQGAKRVSKKSRGA